MMQGDDRARTLLFSEPDAQRVLLYLTDKLAATIFQVAPAVQLDPDRVREMVHALEEAGLVDGAPAGAGSFGGVYAPTAAGVRAAREIRSWKRAM